MLICAQEKPVCGKELLPYIDPYQCSPLELSICSVEEESGAAEKSTCSMDKVICMQEMSMCRPEKETCSQEMAAACKRLHV